MSHQPSHSTENMAPPAEQSEEAIHFGKVIGIGVAAIVLFTIATLLTFRMMRSQQRELQPMGPLPLPAQTGNSEIGIVDQVPFDVNRAVETYRRDKLGRLESWGWVDRKAGIVHMPIDRAMDLVVESHEKKKGEK